MSEIKDLVTVNDLAHIQIRRLFKKMKKKSQLIKQLNVQTVNVYTSIFFTIIL